MAAGDLALPPDFSANVALEAQNAVAGATTEYEKALALQDYFRNNFRYDLSVGPVCAVHCTRPSGEMADSRP